jgi:hypothetical protein
MTYAGLDGIIVQAGRDRVKETLPLSPISDSRETFNPT